MDGSKDQDNRLGRADALLGLGEARFTSFEIAAKAGIDLEDARRLWRAMGFPNPGDDPFFTEADLEVLTRLLDFLKEGLADFDTIVAMTRVVSQALARVADAQANLIKERFAQDLSGSEDVEEAAADVLGGLFPALELFLTHTWRRHLAVALERAHVFEEASSDRESVVGFADIVGFTRLSRHNDEKDLLQVVELLEAKAQDVVSSRGGRIVKMIGDEVMFATPEPADAAEIALALVEDFASDERLPDVRVGLAAGPVLSHRGDLYGPTVNLANRAAGAARPGTVLASAGIHAALDEVPGFELKPVRRRHLKGIGPTRLWSLKRSRSA